MKWKIVKQDLKSSVRRSLTKEFLKYVPSTGILGNLTQFDWYDQITYSTM